MAERHLSARAAFIGSARLLFAAATFVVLYGAFAPSHGGPPLLPWDKAEHFIAFFGLMFLALTAFPRTPLWMLGALLSLEGALIEAVQATPLVGRDADVRDWAADTLGIIAVAGPILLARVRRSLSARA